MTHDKFDKKRFWNTLKLDVASNWRQFSMPFFAIMAGLVCTYMVFLFDNRHLHDPHVMDQMFDSMAMMSLAIGGVAVVLGGSMLCLNLRTKQSRITCLSLPASNQEKFLARYLISTVGMAVVFLAALLTADVLRVLYSVVMDISVHGSIFLWCFTTMWESLTSDFITVCIDLSASILWLWLTNLLTSFVMLHAVYMLGSSLFTRRCVLFTTVVLVLLMMLSELLTPDGELANLFGIKWLGPERFSYMVYLINIGKNLVITALCYWGSYRLFCHSQVISNKWINL